MSRKGLKAKISMNASLGISTLPSKGQVTIPAGVRRTIGVREGDKGFFVRRDDGSVSPFNQSMMATRLALDAFYGATEEAGLRGEEDIAALVRKARADLYAEEAGAPE